MTATAHEFLDYQQVDIHFIYSFNWELNGTEVSAEFNKVFVKGLPRDLSVQEGVLPPASPQVIVPPIFRQWYARPTHERPIPPTPSPSSRDHVQDVDSQESPARCHNNPDAQALSSSYNPAFTVRRLVLAYQDFSEESVFVVVPRDHRGRIVPSQESIQSLKNDRPGLCWLRADGSIASNGEYTSTDTAVIKIDLLWTIRIFDTGTGTASVTVRRGTSCAMEGVPDRAASYQLMHWLLHLAPNTDRHEAPWKLSADTDPTDAFLLLLDVPTSLSLHLDPTPGGDHTSPTSDDDAGAGPKPQVEGEKAQPHEGNWRVTRLFNFAFAVTNASLETFNASYQDGKLKGSSLSANIDFLRSFRQFSPTKTRPSPCSDDNEWEYRFQVWDECQTPFVMTSALVSEPSMSELQDCLSLRRSQEVAALLVKLTLDNKRILTDFARLSRDYLAQYLPTTSDNRLLNMCLDDRVFFTLSRRGALSISPVEVKKVAVAHEAGERRSGRGPAYFVVPSLLNLCELLRTQIHAATSLTWELSDFTGRIAEHSAPESLDEVYEEYAKLRRKLLLNLQNPVTHIFDGGSVTEVAVAAEKLLMIGSAWQQVDKAFSAMDDYIRTSGSIWLSNARRANRRT